MSENFNELFNTEETQATTGARGLAGTAQLTNQAATIASSVITTIESNFSDYRESVAASKVNHDAMDALVAKAYDLSIVDIDFLKALDEDTLNNMLKSQQSKRSRTKGKIMTMDNYRQLMTAGIAENLLRLAMGKDKAAGGTHFGATTEYSPETLETLAADQEALRKEIRNVQSKKSIAKTKADFDEAGDKWQTLLRMEQQLLGIRVGATRTKVETVLVDQTKEELAKMLEGRDLTTIKAADGKELLNAIQAMLSK